MTQLQVAINRKWKGNMKTAQELELALIVAKRSLGLSYLKINTQAGRAAEELREVLNNPLGIGTDNDLFACAKLTLDDYDAALDAHEAAHETLYNLKWDWEQQEDAALNNSVKEVEDTE